MTIPEQTRLLVFDQDTLSENILKYMLKTDRYEVIKVTSNAEGLLITRSWQPEVIIINLMQPSSTGWKLCRKLREISQAPILVLAPISDPNSIARWLDAGADDYLTRPLSSDVLVAHLQKLTRRTKLNTGPLSLLH